MWQIDPRFGSLLVNGTSTASTMKPFRFHADPGSVYLSVVSCLGLIALGHTLYQWEAWSLGPATPVGGLASLILILLSTITGRLKIQFADRHGRLVLGVVFVFLALLLRGIPTACLCALAATVGASWRPGAEGGEEARSTGPAMWRALVFNGLLLVACTYVAGHLFFFLRAEPTAAPVFGRDLMPMVVASLLFALMNTGAVTVAIALAQRRPLRHLLKTSLLWPIPGFVIPAMGALGILSVAPAAGLGFQLAGSTIIALTVYAVYRLYSSRLQELKKLNQSLVSCLAIAIDARDPCTNGHIQRVRYYATEVGRRLGLTDRELEALRTAALLHDVGKLGVPDHLLRKPGKLTPREYAIIQRHVAIGAAILRPVPFNGPVLEYVRTHHERCDGRGYPAGLKDEEIPVGGRILAVVDVFDALTSDRPYRQGLSREEALATIQREAGAHFDPKVVEALVDTPPFTGVDEGQEWSLAAHMTEDEAPDAIDATATHDLRVDRIPELMAPLWVTMDGRPLHVSVEELASVALAQAADILPYTTAIVYLLDEDGRRCQAVSAAGEDAERWLGMTIEVGEGVCGRVVRDHQPRVNYQPLLDIARRVDPEENIELSSGIAVPLQADSTMLGCIAFYHTAYNFYGEDSCQAVQAIGDHLSQAILNLRAGGGVRTDQRTGLPDARALALHWDAGEPSGTGIGLILVGPQRTGATSAKQLETWLSRIAPAVRDELRRLPGSLVMRYGGDMLAVWAPGLLAEQIDQLSRRVADISQAAVWDEDQSVEMVSSWAFSSSTSGALGDLLRSAMARSAHTAREAGSSPSKAHPARN